MDLRPLIATTAALAVLYGAGSAPASIGTPSATVALSTHRAGARPVAVTLRLRYDMQCGWPGIGPLTIRLPTAMTVPLPAIRAATVLVDGKPPTHLASHGHRVELALPPRPQILCDAIAPGTLTITFTRASNLGNPRLPARYELHATKGSLAFQATLIIR
jgi:hypothetical protein